MAAVPSIKGGMNDRKDSPAERAPNPRPQTTNWHLLWAFQTEKELDPDGLRKESEREQAILALTSTLDKLIKRLQENQSPDLVQKHKKKRAVPQKPPPSPPPTGEGRPGGATLRASHLWEPCPQG